MNFFTNKGAQFSSLINYAKFANAQPPRRPFINISHKYLWMSKSFCTTRPQINWHDPMQSRGPTSGGGMGLLRRDPHQTWKDRQRFVAVLRASLPPSLRTLDLLLNRLRIKNWLSSPRNVFLQLNDRRVSTNFRSFCGYILEMVTLYVRALSCFELISFN